jgi:FAD/FMN-containing dehydrogenase
MHPSSPGVTVCCSGTADVIAGVNFAREHGLALAVRGGGHSIAGLSSIDGGVLLDLSPMRGVYVDPERRLAVVQGGALWGDVDRETQAFGLVAPGGVVSDTGVAGLTLGGGYGWVRRKYGLSVDALVEAQVVGADGKVRVASADSHPDLFWALRGGGGNFGVVTSFTFALQPVGPIVAFAATFYPVEEIADVLRVRPSYGSVLLPLWEQDGLRMGQLAERARLSKQTMTTIVRLCERDGLVSRAPDPEDGRATLVSLTERARGFRAVAGQVIAKLERDVGRRLSPTGKRALEEALKEVMEL